MDRARRLQPQARLAHPARAREGQQPHAAPRSRSAIAFRSPSRPIVRFGDGGNPFAPPDPGDSEASAGKSARRSPTTSWKRCSGRSRSLSRCSPRSLSATSPRQLVGDQLARGARDQHLPAVSGRADPRRTVHVQPDVIILSDVRLAGVDAHPHAHVDALGPTLRRPASAARSPPRRSRRSPARRRRRTRRPRCGPRDRRARRTPRAAGADARQHLAVTAAQPRQQPRRTLDVAEQKRHGATRKLRHTRSYAQSPPPVKRATSGTLAPAAARQQKYRSTLLLLTKPAVSCRSIQARSRSSWTSSGSLTGLVAEVGFAALRLWRAQRPWEYARSRA